MPPKKQLPEKQINLLKAWVNAGAVWYDVALKKFGELTPTEKLKELPAGHTPAAALALSADGKHLAAGLGDRVIVRDITAENSPVVATLTGLRDVVQSWLGMLMAPCWRREATGPCRYGIRRTGRSHTL